MFVTGAVNKVVIDRTFFIGFTNIFSLAFQATRLIHNIRPYNFET